MTFYKASGGRLIKRGSGGRFRRTTLEDIGIYNEATCPQICANCSHEWHPIVTTGICPECGCQEKKKREPTREQQAMIDEYTELNKDKFIDPRDKEKLNRICDLQSKLKRLGLL